ncbi:MAG TPA: hypothetical protein VLA89_10800 [Gemmatimonadales bacterium]|nr:hypothetical protein [Gemmatimonadales bacterium]
MPRGASVGWIAAKGWKSSAYWILLGIVALSPSVGWAQDEAANPNSEVDTTLVAVADTSRQVYQNEYIGQFSPGSGFDLLRTKRGSLNISFYGLFRYVNQLPADQTFTDHLGRTRTVKTNNMINWHRTFVWLTGFFYDQRFRYNISLWSLPTTQQTLLFGNLRYIAAKEIVFGVGLGPNLTARSMQGSWPYWAGSDRQMAEEFHRGGFSSSAWITGEALPRFFYTAAVTNNLSQLGVVAANDTRDMGYGVSIWTMPTTGEFGPRGGFGDLEHHMRPATRFGASATHSRENRYAQLDQGPNATQIRLSDGVFPFEANALAEDVTVNFLDYDEMAFDAGLKYKGFSLQGEYYFRQLSKFDATWTGLGAAPASLVPHSAITDHGFMVEAGKMVVPRKLNLYAAAGYVFDHFDRKPWEIAGGASFYPYGNRVWRLNLHLIRIEKSPTGSSFGYYTAGQSGTTLSIGTDLLL